MERKKIPKRNNEITRIPLNQKHKITNIGEGSFRQGLTKIITIYEKSIRDPENILMNDIDRLMDDLRLYYSTNHYNHFSNFPACFRLFLKRGWFDSEILNTRLEKPIDDFEKTMMKPKKETVEAVK